MEAETPKDHGNEFGWFTRVLAWRCEICPLCRYARANPHSRISKAVQFHGKFCPAWRAHVKVYNHTAEN
jgi:hypothetical protein